MTDFCPRRSVLYMPGANERALEKAKGLPADALILDLEDAVAPSAKDEARGRVCAAAGSGEYGHREVTIRANGRDTSWHDADLVAIATSGAAAVVIPKVGSAADVQAVDRALIEAGAPDDLQIWAMIETPDAVANADQIANASDRLTVFVLGTNDLVKELQAEFVDGRAPIQTALQQVVLAARRTGTVVLDGVFNALDDDAGFLAECVQGRQWGFDGKTLIHPKQIGPCNETWAPTVEAVAKAREVIGAFEEAEAAGQGVVIVDGRMIENLHVEQARRTLAIADAIDSQV